MTWVIWCLAQIQTVRHHSCRDLCHAQLGLTVVCVCTMSIPKPVVGLSPKEFQYSIHNNHKKDGDKEGNQRRDAAPWPHTVNRVRESCKFIQTLEFSFHRTDYDIVKPIITKANQEEADQKVRELQWANVWWRSIEIEKIKKEIVSLDHSRALRGKVESLKQRLKTPLNHCVVCLWMPMFTERRVIQKNWLQRGAPRYSLCLGSVEYYKIHPSQNENVQKNTLCSITADSSWLTGLIAGWQNQKSVAEIAPKEKPQHHCD